MATAWESIIMATAATPDTKRLELSVSNFGPIAEGRIELRPFTVFVGPSNTGKSYLATLIYALHRFFGAPPMNAWLRGMPGHNLTHEVSSLVLQRKIDLLETDVATVRAWESSDWYKTLTSISQLETLPHEADLPADISQVVRKVLRGIEHLSNGLDNEIVRCFGTEQSQNLVRYPSGTRAEFAVSDVASNVARQTGSFRYGVVITVQGAKMEAAVTDAMPVKVNQGPLHPRSLSLPEDTNDDHEMRPRLILADLSSNALANSVGPIGQPAYYLPADRAGFTHSSRMVIGNLIADASRRYFHPDSPRAPVLKGVIGDFLEQLVMLTSAVEQRKREP